MVPISSRIVMCRTAICLIVVRMHRVDVRPPTPGELLRGVLPHDGGLAQPLWLARHRALLALLALHVVLLPVWGAVNGEPLSHVLGAELLLLGLTVFGAVARSRTLAASAVSLGLVSSAAVLVHAGDGRTILHFHFFLVVAALALYRQWLPFLLALGFVLVDHVVMGLVAPESVYDDAFSLQSPWLAAAVHAAYVLAVAAVTAVTWTWSERERRTAEERAEQEAARVRDSERRLTALLDNAPSSIFVKGTDGRFLDANRGMQQAMGMSLQEVAGRTTGELFGADSSPVAEAHDARVLQERVASEVVEVNVVAGAERTLSVVKFPLLDDAGEVTAIAGIATDITERTLAEQALRASERRLREIFDRGPVPQMVLQPDGTLTEVNPAFCELVGYAERELLGMRLASLVAPQDRPAVTDLLEPQVRAPGPRRRELRMLTRDGIAVHAKVSVAEVADGDAAAYCVGMVEDVTEARRAAAELDRRATHDTLTGLPNRDLLLTRIAAALEQPDSRVAVLFLDLDGFKEINDSLGHDAGDQLLRTVAQRLDALRAPGDTLARLGGDEFVLCSAGSPEPEQAREVAARMLAALRTPMSVAERAVEIGGSIGIALGRGSDGATPMLLLRDADTALYDAKAAGRGRSVVFAPELRERDERRRRLQGDLVAVLRGAPGLFLEFQPEADADTGRVVTCEALVRWQHPEDGRLAPEAFLPLAADKGLLPALDRWVLEQACTTAAQWPTHAGPVSVAVNITPQTIADENVVDWVRETCQRTGLPPHRLVVELTETAVVERPQETSRALAGLRAMGVCVALDDFGTGYSSLSHLRDLPIDVVKIDRAFTAGATSSRRDAAIIRATADLARALDASLVAEGVETAEQRDAVVAAGAQLLQGWHISRPLSQQAVADLLAAQSAAVPAPRTGHDVVQLRRR